MFPGTKRIPLSRLFSQQTFSTCHRRKGTSGINNFNNGSVSLSVPGKTVYSNIHAFTVSESVFSSMPIFSANAEGGVTITQFSEYLEVALFNTSIQDVHPFTAVTSNLELFQVFPKAVLLKQKDFADCRVDLAEKLVVQSFLQNSSWERSNTAAVKQQI